MLDRLQDYVRYGINPPEPELQEEYDRLLREHQQREQLHQANDKHFAKILMQWKKMVEWHQKDHPGVQALVDNNVEALAEHLKMIEGLLNKKIAVSKDQKELTKINKDLASIAKLKKLQQQTLALNKGGDDKKSLKSYKALALAHNKALSHLEDHIPMPTTPLPFFRVPKPEISIDYLTIEFSLSESFAFGFDGFDEASKWNKQGC